MSSAASRCTRWVLIIFVLGFICLHATASSEKQKLLKWVHENSDMFVMLKHWNDLPLISTAWKRLKTTPAVQEDRKNFLRSVEYFLELWGDQMEIKLQSSNNSNTSVDPTQKINTTLDAVPSNSSVPSFQIPSSVASGLKETFEAQSNGTLPNVELKRSEKNTERDAEIGTQSSIIDNASITASITSLSAGNDISLNPCSCTGK